MNHVAHLLAKMGLEVGVDGDFILCEDPNLDFERSHDGVRGISRWLAETREEYKAAMDDLLKDEEEPMNEFAAAPPVKDHAGPEAQMEMAREFNSPKEVAQSGDDQDRGGIPSPEAYIRDMKMEAPAITILVRGHTFHAPDGWKIRETQPDNVFYMASINIGRKKNHELKGSKFSLVRS
jgi:hypothetical protein